MKSQENQQIQKVKPVRLSAAQRKEMESEIRQDIINLYTQHQIEQRLMAKYGFKQRGAQANINKVREEILNETTIVEIEEVRESQKTFILSRIHYCLEQANKKLPSYEKLLMEWIGKYNQLWPNELKVEKVDGEKIINISFQRLGKPTDIIKPAKDKKK